MGKVLIAAALLALFEVASAFAAAPQTITGEESQENLQRIEISVDNYSFTPSRLVVKQNIPTELIFKSVTRIVPHNFVLKSPDAGMTIEEEIAAGATTVVRFTPARIGEFKFSCTKKLLFFPSHEEQGMVGTLVVVR